MEFNRNKSATFTIDNCYINEELLYEQLLEFYGFMQDEWIKNVLAEIISHRPRGLGKVNMWWQSIITTAQVLSNFKYAMDEVYDTIQKTLYYDYGHYFVKEKYETTKEPVWQKVDYYHINEWVPYVLKDVTRKVGNNGSAS